MKTINDFIYERGAAPKVDLKNIKTIPMDAVKDIEKIKEKIGSDKLIGKICQSLDPKELKQILNNIKNETD